MAYDASKREDVARLAMNLATTPREDWWKVLGHVYGLGLMKFGGLLGVAFWATKKLRGHTGVLYVFKVIDAKFGGFLKGCMLATIEHVVTGTDREDVNSVGGWSQREIDMFASKVSFSADAA